MYKEVYYLPALFMGCGGSRKTSCDGLANKKQQQLASTITGNSVHHVVKALIREPLIIGKGSLYS